MSARMLTRPVAVLLLVAGVTGVVSARPTDEPPKEPPKKTTAELLIGTWRQVKEGKHELPAEGPLGVFLEFADRGKLTIRIMDGRNRPPIVGRYRLDGNHLRLSAEKTFDQDAIERTLLIRTLTEAELVYETEKGKEDEEVVTAKYRRVTEKSQLR
ncbi:MAG: hypothetical protein K2X82_31440 [Gemmataceae bacterium]|nr:hypothetical protein [Gemmataceae bacterium]